jgi:ribonuclease HII
MSSKTSPLPSLSFEQSLGSRYVIGIDEVGRGCIAGPVAVGAVLIDLQDISSWPEKLQDSKLLTPKARTQMFESVTDWVSAWSVGLSSVEEIESQGIMAALGLAASRALMDITNAHAKKLTTEPTVILLDGNLDYLGTKAMGFKVQTKIKADQDCVSVAAASVLAKVTRDNLMVELAGSHPAYNLDSNKGYASADHIKALREVGPSPIHRLSWLTKILAE